MLLEASTNRSANHGSPDLSSVNAFVLAGVNVFVPSSCFLEFVPQAAVFAVPHAQARCVGVLQRRGTIYPVFDASSNLSERKPAKLQSVLLTGEGQKAVALLVTQAPELLAIKHSKDAVKPSSCVFYDALIGSAKTLVNPTLGDVEEVYWALDIDTLIARLSQTS